MLIAATVPTRPETYDRMRARLPAALAKTYAAPDVADLGPWADPVNVFDFADGMRLLIVMLGPEPAAPVAYRRFYRGDSWYHVVAHLARLWPSNDLAFETVGHPDYFALRLRPSPDFWPLIGRRPDGSRP
jgi:hypothetical protein